MALANTAGVRLQKMDLVKQALVLARFAQTRFPDGQITAKQLDGLFCESTLPGPSMIGNLIIKLRREKLITKGNKNGTWRLTPLGRQTSIECFSDLDLAAFTAESAASSSSLGEVAHTVVSPALAPPSLIPALRKFLEEHPFETNVFGMTRFPDNDEKEKIQTQ